jgi:hypothetical protein
MPGRRVVRVRRCITRSLVVIAVISLTSCASKKSDSVRDAAQRRDAVMAALFKSRGLEQRERIASVETAYSISFPQSVRDDIVSKANTSELSHFFDAANVAASTTLDPRPARDALLALATLKRLGAATDKQLRTARELVLKTRMFEAGAQFDLPLLKDESDDRAPTELFVEPDGMIRRSITMTGSQILVVSHPMCGFSAAAMEAIGTEPALAAVFARNARWLVPQEISGDLEPLRKPSRFRFTLAYKRTEFPMIDSWETPTFYFLKDGRVEKKVQGWPKQGRMQEILDGLRAINLEPR